MISDTGLRIPESENGESDPSLDPLTHAHTRMQMAVPHIRWSRQEIKLVAQQCALLYRAEPPKKYVNKHFQVAQRVLPEGRRKKHIASHELIDQLRYQISIVPLPPDPAEDTDAVHNGAYDTSIPAEVSQNGARSYEPLPANEFMPRQETPRFSSPAQGGDVTEKIVDILTDIILKSLSLSLFTASQLQECFSNRIDTGRIRNLTIKANNSLTYFEELIRLAQ